MDPWTTWIWTVWVHLYVNFFTKYVLPYHTKLSWLNLQIWHCIFGGGGLTIKLQVNFQLCGLLAPLTPPLFKDQLYIWKDGWVVITNDPQISLTFNNKKSNFALTVYSQSHGSNHCQSCDREKREHRQATCWLLKLLLRSKLFLSLICHWLKCARIIFMSMKKGRIIFPQKWTGISL